MKLISSSENPHFRSWKKLFENAKEREKQQKTLLDGIHLVSVFCEKKGQPEAVILKEGWETAPEIAHFLQHVKAAQAVFVLPEVLFKKLTALESHTGILAVIHTALPESPPSLSADTLLLDRIQDAGNVGSILRSAAALGFSQILLSEGCAKVWSPKTLRAAMGANFSLVIYESFALSDFIAHFEGITFATLPLAEKSIEAYALHETPVAWLLGNEGQGIALELISDRVRPAKIPMTNATESLNVAAAAAICLFETQRQRN